MKIRGRDNLTFMNNSNFKITLIVPTYNEEKSFEKWMDSFRKQIELPDELIIIDGGSQDKTIELFHKCLSEIKLPFQIISDPSLNKKNHPGPIGAARNKGIMNSKYEYIVCTDMGVIFSDNWFLGIKNAFKKGAMAVKGKYIATNNYKSAFNFSKYFTPSNDKYFRVDFLPSSRNIGFKKSIWEKAGKYPEDSYTGEDTLFAIKVLNLVKFEPVNEGYVDWTLPCDKELAVKIQEYAKGDRKLKLFFLKYVIKFFAFRLFAGERRYIWENEIKGYFK